jgi:hypothetical protein
VAASLRLEVCPQSGGGEPIVPVGAPRSHQIAVGVIDIEGRDESMPGGQKPFEDIIPFF